MYELNIGLNCERNGNSPAAIELRAAAVAECLNNMQAVGSIKVVGVVKYVNEYQTNGGDVIEPGIAVKFVVASRDCNVANLCQVLAGVADQDCIALYNPEAGNGALIGPLADQWGAFNLAYFKRFQDAADDKLLADLNAPVVAKSLSDPDDRPGDDVRPGSRGDLYPAVLRRVEVDGKFKQYDILLGSEYRGYASYDDAALAVPDAIATRKLLALPPKRQLDARVGRDAFVCGDAFQGRDGVPA